MLVPDSLRCLTGQCIHCLSRHTQGQVWYQVRAGLLAHCWGLIIFVIWPFLRLLVYRALSCNICLQSVQFLGNRNTIYHLCLGSFQQLGGEIHLGFCQIILVLFQRVHGSEVCCETSSSVVVYSHSCHLVLVSNHWVVSGHLCGHVLESFEVCKVVYGLFGL